jgi:hypothetical protein
MSVNTETLLREALEAGAGALDVPDDPWSRFAGRERAHRRNRRVRAGVALTALAAAVGVQTGVVPLPGWAPGIAVAGRETSLINSPIRGSLAGDQAFLAGMRRRIKNIAEPGELWQVADRSKIKFVYAADVPGHRLSLALVPLRFGFLTDQALIWYEGKPGAAPADMRESGRVDGGETVVTYLDGAADRTGVLVVVAPQGATVAVRSGFTYTAQGRVRHGDPVVSTPGNGLAEVTVPPAQVDPGITVTVTSKGRTLFSGPPAGGWSGPAGDPQEPTDAMIDRALAGRAFDRLTLRSWVSLALRDARLTAAGTTVGLRWTGTVNGQPAALLTLRQPGSGVLAYAVHGSADSYRQDLRLLLPAAGVDRRPIAWRMRAGGKDDRTDQLVVVAPAGAARVTLSPAGAPPVPVPLDATGAGIASLAPDATASVTAYAADGSTMGSTPVTPFETDLGGLPGDDLKTRVVE